MASGKCDRETKVHLVDGSAWADPAKLLESTADQLPMMCGVLDLKNGADELFWVLRPPPKTPTRFGR
jgi:hypothetical protein